MKENHLRHLGKSKKKIERNLGFKKRRGRSKLARRHEWKKYKGYRFAN